MEYKNLGRTGLKVSRFCLGTFNFYHATSEEEAFSLLDKVEEVGINFIDTANIYGKEKRSPGAAESLIGEWLQKEKGRRNNFVISTKVFGPTGGGPNQRGLSAYQRARHTALGGIRSPVKWVHKRSSSAKLVYRLLQV